jgi:hypothetical protein
MTDYADVRRVMETQLAETLNMPTLVFQNTTFNPDPTVAYVHCQLSPGNRRPASRGPNPQMRLEGYFIMNVCGVKNSGAGCNADVAQRLIERFEGSTDLVSGDVRVGINYAELGINYEDTTHFCTPVVVSWYAYT